MSGLPVGSTPLPDRTSALVNWSLAANDPLAAATQLHAALRAVVAGPAAPVASPAAPLPSGAGSIPTGTVTGTVELSTTLAALGGVAIQAYSATGRSNCPITTCAQTSSSSNGSFTAIAPVGADYLQFSLSYNLTNITYCTVAQGMATDAGTIYMVPEAVLTGTIEVNTSSHPKLPGTSVSAVSQDNSLVGSPIGASSSQGTFTAGLPPVPSIVTFSPPFGYESTFLFESATPGEHLDIGTVYIQKDPVVRVHVYDAVTGQPITGTCTFAVANQCNTLTVCSAITPSSCGAQGVATGSSTVTAVGPAGYRLREGLVLVRRDRHRTHRLCRLRRGDVRRRQRLPHSDGYRRITVDLTTEATTHLPPNMPTGIVWVSACNLDGLYFGDPIFNSVSQTVNLTATQCNGRCVALGSSLVFQALPLATMIRIDPDTQGLCGLLPQWPIPSDLPVFGNESWINITPDEVTPFYTNLSIGDYVAGNVSVNHGAVPTDFTVTPVAIDNPSYADAFPAGLQPFSAQSGSTAPCRSAFAWDTGPDAFCVAVPPGSSELRVQSSLFPYGENFTWGSVPNMCCAGAYPMTLSEYTSDRATSINLSSLGDVYGHVAETGTGQGVFYASYSITAAGTHSNAPTFSGAVALNGTIYSPASFGWDAVTISASGFSPNTVWVDVTGNDSFGTVFLTPLATVAGRVVDPAGNGIIGATVFYCSIVQTSTCSTPLGAGLATTGGGYNGTLPGLFLPYSTYEIFASSSGYSADWTWVNTTQGQVIIAPTLVLHPVGAEARPIGGTTINPFSRVDLTGYLIDNSSGQGIETGGSSLQVCSTATGSCFNLDPGTNSQGLFNTSVPVGTYRSRGLGSRILRRPRVRQRVGASGGGPRRAPTLPASVGPRDGQYRSRSMTSRSSTRSPGARSRSQWFRAPRPSLAPPTAAFARRPSQYRPTAPSRSRHPPEPTTSCGSRPSAEPEPPRTLGSPGTCRCSTFLRTAPVCSQDLWSSPWTRWSGGWSSTTRPPGPVGPPRGWSSQVPPSL